MFVFLFTVLVISVLVISVLVISVLVISVLVISVLVISVLVISGESGDQRMLRCRACGECLNNSRRFVLPVATHSKI